ncbi:ABC transporter substrate-binding protein [Acidovorax sp. DW039]|uniref:ABC transporter substrate-binding protein n=1 Tax=Acidovorax sp. DW039 TaxID=3095606 RepID=UPI0030908DF6|nr:ABC transporter substrate-binding protein [Acidovorax sp. DW039]
MNKIDLRPQRSLESTAPAASRRRTLALLGGVALAASPWCRSVTAEASMAAPASVTRFAAPEREEAVLRIDSSTDTVLFAPAIRDFQRLHPSVTVWYADRQSLDMHARALAFAAAARSGSALGRPEIAVPEDAPDLIISSSPDLQTQLANDGLAWGHQSPQTRELPEGAHWRREVFTLGADAVVMAYNPRLLPVAQVPRTRGQLLALLRQPGSPLQGRIGMYDATRSGLGYLLATQDSRFDSTASVLLAAMGEAGVRLGDHIEPLLDRLEKGELALVYNVPASYPLARMDAGASLRVVVPEDYTLLTTRVALIPTTAPHPEKARPFLDYLLSPQGQAVLARDTRLLPVRQAVAAARDGRALALPGRVGAASALSAASAEVAPGSSAWRLLSPGLGLLAYLDPLKRQRFLQAWATSVQPRK